MAYFHFEDVEELDVMDAFLLFAPNTLHDAPGVIACFFPVTCQEWSRDFRTQDKSAKNSLLPMKLKQFKATLLTCVL